MWALLPIMTKMDKDGNCRCVRYEKIVDACVSPCLYSPVCKAVATWPMCRLGAFLCWFTKWTATASILTNYVQIQQDIKWNQIGIPDCLQIFVGAASSCRWMEWWTWAPSSNSLPGIALPRPGRKAHTTTETYVEVFSGRDLRIAQDLRMSDRLVIGQSKRSYSYNTTQVLQWNQSAIIRICTKGHGVWYSI